jgi:sialate O-acetylesterase
MQIYSDKVPGSAAPEQITIKYNPEKGWLNAPLVGFAIAGEDRKFVWAKAEVQGDKVVVWSPQVGKPVAARYGWADCPVVNLVCSPSFAEPVLPASPFRTDDWPMITAPKQEAKK